MRNGVIYVLKHPSTLEIRYCGKTIVLPARRYASHIYQWKRSVGNITHVNSWIKSLALQGLKPIMEIIMSDIPELELAAKEIEHIKIYRDLGVRLCNHTDGGEGSIGYVPTPESKIKRLQTQSTSFLWKQKCIDHSSIMQEKHKKGDVKFGYSHLSEETRILIGNQHSINMITLRKLHPEKYTERAGGKKKCAHVDIDGIILQEFDSCTAAGLHFKIPNSNIVRVCKSKSPHARRLLFKYLD